MRHFNSICTIFLQGIDFYCKMWYANIAIWDNGGCMIFDKNDISGIENAIDRYLYSDYNSEPEYLEEELPECE